MDTASGDCPAYRSRGAGDLHDDGIAAIRFPSHLDGNPCIAVFEGRGDLHLDGAIVPLTDLPPKQLLEVAAAWHLTLAPAPVLTSKPD